MGRALRNYFRDLFSGDPVALGLTGFFLLLGGLALTIWLIDLRRRKREADEKAKRASRVERRTKT